MSTDNIVVANNTIQTISNIIENTVKYATVLHEPIIYGSQGPEGIKGQDGSALKLSAIPDIDTTILKDGSILVYNSASEMWKVTTVLEKQTLECGQY